MRAAALAVLLTAVGVLPAAALDVPPLTGRVVDLADVLSLSTEAALTARLTAHEDSTSNQVVVLTIPSLEGEILEAYATRVFRTWGLGQADRDNGVLLLVAVGDREVRVEVGYGLEGDLTDATAGSIIRHEIVPRFRDGDFDAGVLAGTEAILQAIDGAYEPPTGAGEGPTLFGGLLFGILYLLFLGFVVVPPIVTSGGVGLEGDLEAGFFGALAGGFAGFGLVMIDVGWWAVVLAVLGLIPLAIVMNRWFEAHPTWGPKRRHARAKEEAFSAARQRGDKRVVVDGRSYSVPAAASGSSGGGFSGGGGSSGGGGASGSW